MNVWFVTPAWSRTEVTRLALAQRAHLQGELAARGISVSCVVVADDDNLEAAEEFGFKALWQDNEFLGRKVNDGIEHACAQGADWVCFAGSDNWIHPDLFDSDSWMMRRDPSPIVIAGWSLAVVDLVDPRLLVAKARSWMGAPPWLISRAALEPSGFRPAQDDARSGMEMSLRLGLGNIPWTFEQPHDLVRVDFKSHVGMTAFAAMEHLRMGETRCPWDALGERYPADLVEMARATSESLSAVAA